MLRGFVQRKLRVLLTAIAIALGVALMAGTYILTDTINHAFAEVFATAYANKAVVVTEKETLGGSQVSVLSEATLARVRAVPGVAAASGSISSQAALLTTSGKRLTSGGAPGASMPCSRHASRPSPRRRAICRAPPRRWRSTRRAPSATTCGSASRS